MALLTTKWTAVHDGNTIMVERNEFTRGFKVFYGSREVATKKWSLVGTGTMEGAITEEGPRMRIRVSFPSTCEVWINESPIEVIKS